MNKVIQVLNMIKFKFFDILDTAVGVKLLID